MTAERYTRQQARAEKRAIFKQLRQLRQEQERQRPHGTKKGRGRGARLHQRKS